MKSPFISTYHPDSQALMAYAEGLVDSQASLNPEVAGHLKNCESCQEKIRAMRDSLSIINAIEEIESTTKLTASILLAAKEKPSTSSSMGVWLRNTAVAASVLLVATLGLGHISTQQPSSIPAQATASIDPVLRVEEAVVESKEEITKNAALAKVLEDSEPVHGSSPTERLVSKVVNADYTPKSEQQKQQYSSIKYYNASINECEIAMASNPALVSRVNGLVSDMKEKRDEMYTRLYMDGK